jgi:hypothetical protein
MNGAPARRAGYTAYTTFGLVSKRQYYVRLGPLSVRVVAYTGSCKAKIKMLVDVAARDMSPFPASGDELSLI